MVYKIKTILAACLLVWTCQGQSNQILDDNSWISEMTIQAPDQKSTVPCYVDNEEGQCVKPSECMDSNIDLQQLSVYRDLTCPYLKLCCPKSRVVKTVITPPVPNMKVGCGWSNPGGHILRYSSNTHAMFAEFPWMVALLRKASQNQAWNYFGGGTLIHHSVVMTTAHKLIDINYDPVLIKCRLGEWDTQTRNENFPHQDRDVSKIIVHEKFSLRNSAYNIALVITSSPFDTSHPHVGIACLSYNEPDKKDSCYSMGWGKDFNNNDKYAELLKKVQLPIVDHYICENDFQGSRLGRNFRLHKTLLCAGGIKNSDTCYGDGGSPLACRTSSNGTSPRYTVYGMVAFGIDCGTPIAAAYVNVPSVLAWITRKFNEEKLEITFFA